MELFFTNNKFEIAGTSFPGVPFFVGSNYVLHRELNDFFMLYIVPDGRTSSPKTWKSYAYWLLDYFKWLEAVKVSFENVTRKEVAAYRNWSLETCGLKPDTVNRRITAIKKFYEFCVEKSWVSENPIAEVQSTRKISMDSDYLSHTKNNNKYIRNDLSVTVYSELPKVYSDLDIKLLFEFTKSSRLRLMMHLLLECGFRRAELALLPYSIVLDLEKSALKAGPDSFVLVKLPRDICKNRKAREVPISYALAMKLRQYRLTTRNRLCKVYRAKNKSSVPDRFWLTEKGTVLRPESIYNEIAQLGRDANVKGATVHKFRHTFATKFYSITGDLRAVQKLLGHSNIQTTTVYEHITGEDQFGYLEDYQQWVDRLIEGGSYE